MSLENSNPESKPKRAQLNYALIDVNFPSKPKIKALSLKFEPVARLWLYEIILDLSRSTNAEMDEDLVLAMAEELGITNPIELLTYCLDKGILDRSVTGAITQRRVIEDQEKLAVEREKSRERQKKARETNAPVTRDMSVTTAREARLPVTATVTDTDLDQKECDTNPIPIKSLNNSEVREALGRWSRYNAERLNKRFDDITRESVLLNYSGRPKDLIRDIDGCISSGWRVLRDCSDLAAKPQTNGYHASAAQTVPLSQSKVRGAEIYKPPPDEHHTPEQKAANLTKLKALTERIL